MKYFVTCSFLIAVVGLSAQSTPSQDSLQAEIDEQVWRPFIKAYNNFDTDAFMHIHTRDLLRIIRDNNVILKADVYAKNVEKNNRSSKETGRQVSISFSFLERMAIEDSAFEVGYYKVVSRDKEGKKRNFYGKFHVILKKIDGRWKIAVDSDTSMDGAITEEDFQKGKLLK